MSMYRKKPIVIEAKQLNGQFEMDEICQWLTFNKVRFSTNHLTIYIETLEGIMTASHRDYIIKGIKGEFYPCKPDIFEQTYEIVSG